jgi:hypothetical protein
MKRVLNGTVLVMSHSGNDPRAARNIHFTLKHYLDGMPGMSAVVVEQNPKPCLKAADLPGGAYRFLKTTGRHGRGRAFNTGFKMCESSKEFFIFSDSGILIEPIDLKPNLLMCARRDFASSFRHLYALEEEDTLRCLSGDFRWPDPVYRGSERPNLCSSCCIISRRGMRIVGPWKEIGDDADEDMSQRISSVLGSYYESPNRARLLSST